MSKQNGGTLFSDEPTFPWRNITNIPCKDWTYLCGKMGIFDDDVSTTKTTVTWWLYGYDSSHFLVLRTATNTPQNGRILYSGDPEMQCYAPQKLSWCGPEIFLGKEGRTEDLCAGGKLCVFWWQSDLTMLEHA